MRNRLYQLAAAMTACGLFAGCSCHVACSTPCGDGCRGTSPYAFQKYEACCETCGPPDGYPCGACLECGDKCACGRSLRWLGALTDCAGCGERYWSEWYNDPPRCAEPCDCCGNWIGPGHQCSCCSPKPYCCPPAGYGNGAEGHSADHALAEEPARLSSLPLPADAAQLTDEMLAK
jgi:hypothetical protein